jgi:hypothetical protein
MARNMVANWMGVHTEQVFLWWSASMIEDAFPQQARLLLDDDQTQYEHGAIYFDITNDLGDQDNLSLASMPCLARFLRFGGVGFGPPPVFRSMDPFFPQRLRVVDTDFPPLFASPFGSVIHPTTNRSIRRVPLRDAFLARARLRDNVLARAQRDDGLASVPLRSDFLASTQVQEDYHDMPELVQDSDDDMELVD